jgi:ABC-type transport system substrate-binding protein
MGRGHDAHTVKFTLKYPSATLLPVMAAHALGFLQMSPASYERWGREEERQRRCLSSMMTCGIASLPFLQAARTDVKGYVYLHGDKIRFDTTWLDKP